MTPEPTADRTFATRVIALICFWLSIFPVLVGLVSLIPAPGAIAHYWQGLDTPGTESYHRDMQRAFVESVGNVVVRIVAFAVLVGFAAITVWPRRRLQLIVFSAAIVTAGGHLFLPIVTGGPFMAVIWRHPLYVLPALVGILSAISVWLLISGEHTA